MRTTLTIDKDVAVQLERLRKKRDIGLKEAVNEALRLGLREMKGPQNRPKPFQTRPYDAGTSLLTNVDNVAEVIALLEGELHK
jgi:hypothetical protein